MVRKLSTSPSLPVVGFLSDDMLHTKMGANGTQQCYDLCLTKRNRTTIPVSLRALFYSQCPLHQNSFCYFTQQWCRWTAYLRDTLWSRYDRARLSLCELARQPLKFWLEIMGVTKVVIGRLWYPQDFFFRFCVLSRKKGHFVCHLTPLQKIEPIMCCWLHSSWTSCYDKELWRLLIKYITAKSNTVAANYAQGNSKRKLPIVKIHRLYIFHHEIHSLAYHFISNVTTVCCSKL